MTLPPGTKLGPYQTGGPLGASGEEYRARDTRLDRSVAVKVLPTHLSSVSDLRERFEREARTISSLNHPHICALYDIGSQDGVDYLVMEYLEGQTLADRLAESVRPSSGSATVSSSRALKLEEALAIAQQIADALDKAHRQGVVHRDLKPGNIMLTASGAKLLDFGLAKQSQSPVSMGAHKSAAAHRRRHVVGHAAVHVARAARGTRSRRAHRCICVRRDALRNGDRPRRVRRQDAMKNCLAKNPDQRWQSMADVSLQLRMIADTLGDAETSIMTGTVAWQLRRARFTAAAVAALLVAGAAAGAAWWPAPTAPEPLPPSSAPATRLA